MRLNPRQLAFVTGAASGIGLEISRELARRGLLVAMADKNGRELAQQVQAVRDQGGQAEPFELDVADAQMYCDVASSFAAMRGAPDLLFNNAGSLGPRGHVQELSTVQWRQLFDINFFGIVHGLELFLPAMIEKGTPAHVVNTASIAGLRAFKALLPVSVYATSKYAVVGLSETLRHDLEGTNVGVSVLCPGVVATNIFADESVPDAGTALAQRAEEKVLSACQAAGIALAGVEAGRFYIFTHPENRGTGAGAPRKNSCGISSDLRRPRVGHFLPRAGGKL